jgi:TM2 domain-containing membrane protein YozV
MSCYNHPGLGSVAICSNCGKEICAACATEFNEKVVCRDCADKLRKEAPQQVPAPVEEADNGQKPAEAPHVPPAPEPSKETMPATVPASVPAVPTAPASLPPEPPKMAPSVAAPAEKKEPLLALLLSAIIPGLGQMYNGQVKKGIVLLIGCILLWIVVVVFSSAMTRSNAVTGCCCLTFWIPLLVNVYAAYDGYVTAGKINKGEQVKDWLS